MPSDTVTSCPYKGTTTGYWSALADGRTHPDVAWTYDFPTRDLLPIAGLIAFYNEKVDLFLDGVQLERTAHELLIVNGRRSGADDASSATVVAACTPPLPRNG